MRKIPRAPRFSSPQRDFTFQNVWVMRRSHRRSRILQFQNSWVIRKSPGPEDSHRRSGILQFQNVWVMRNSLRAPWDSHPRSAILQFQGSEWWENLQGIPRISSPQRDFTIPGAWVMRKSRESHPHALVNKNWTQILLFSSVNIRLPYNAMLLLFLS